MNCRLGLLGVGLFAAGCGETNRDFGEPGAGGESAANVPGTTGAAGSEGGDAGADDLRELAEDGARCQASRECQSGFCADGVCCASACDGTCQTCAAPAHEGTCQISTGSPPAGKACAGEGLCQGSCDGESAECVFPGADVQCESAFCSNTTATSSAASLCDGAGACVASAKPVTCGDYACDGDACRTDCRHDGDCGGDAVCIDAAFCIVFQKKRIELTTKSYVPNGIAGADAACQAELGTKGGTWRALIVGGSRTATLAPYAGNGRSDWVIQKYTEYYNAAGRLIWTTLDIPLLGVRDGARVPLAYPAFEKEFAYPWAGYEEDWTTDTQQNCDGWASTSQDGGGFAYNTLLPTGALELCTSSEPYVCVEQ